MYHILWYKCGTFRAQNRGSDTQNRKLLLNISKLEYYGAFWQKIRKLKFFSKNLKNRGLGGPKPKITPKYLKTRVFWGFLVKNPKIENF